MRVAVVCGGALNYSIEKLVRARFRETCGI